MVNEDESVVRCKVSEARVFNALEEFRLEICDFLVEHKSGSLFDCLTAGPVLFSQTSKFYHISKTTSLPERPILTILRNHISIFEIIKSHFQEHFLEQN